MVDRDTSGDSGIRHFLANLSVSARWALGAGIGACLLLSVLILWWATRTSYQVLFANLEESDAATVVQELKRQKMPYKLSNEGRTINVPAERVYETRLSLMTGGVPLTGGVGFEIFDRQGLGATEQSQRVAYQRALQGELSRTIGALEHVRQARVLLVIPESTLFKRDQQKSRAAVWLTLEPNTRLDGDQISGVQRLVAASVAGLDMDQVVITDQRGVTLSETDAGSLNGVATGARLKLKTEFEKYIAQKIAAMLERVAGPGQAIVSVDATLNFDQITRTLQSVVPVSREDTSGGVLRRRESRTKGGSNAEAASSSGTGSESTSVDVEYEFSKRLEQVAAAPGALTRISVGVVVPGTLTPEREDRLLQLVKVAAGIDMSRGDTVVVDSLERIAMPGGNAVVSAPDGEAPQVGSVPATGSTPNGLLHLPTGSLWIAVAIAMLAAVSIGVTAWLRRNSARSAIAREQLLSEIVESLQSARPDGAGRI